MIPFVRIKEIFKEAVEDLGAYFFYGSESDAWLEKLKADTTTHEHCFVLLQPTAGDITISEDRQFETHPYLISFSKQDIISNTLVNSADNRQTFEAIYIDTYNARQEVLNYIKDNYSGEIEIGEKSYRYFAQHDNLCTGVICSLSIAIATPC